MMMKYRHMKAGEKRDDYVYETINIVHSLRHGSILHDHHHTSSLQKALPEKKALTFSPNTIFQ